MRFARSFYPWVVGVVGSVFRVVIDAGTYQGVTGILLGLGVKNVFYGFSLFLCSVVALVEVGFVFLQMGIFLFLVLFFSSEHSMK